jgi:hypothetical protein
MYYSGIHKRSFVVKYLGRYENCIDFHLLVLCNVTSHTCSQSIGVQTRASLVIMTYVVVNFKGLTEADPY